MSHVSTHHSDLGGPVAHDLQRRTTTESVADVLRDEIRRGMLPANSRLRQSEVASRLGVSTTPVREAFALLQAEGLVQIDRHRGAVVFQPSVADLREFYEIRENLEALAVRLAIPNLTEALLEDLDGLIDEMRECADDQLWMELNDRFHLSLYSVSGRNRLCSMISSLRDSSRVYIHMFVAHRAPNERADDEHAAIVDASRAGDPDAADLAVRTHLRVAAVKDAEILESPQDDE